MQFIDISEDQLKNYIHIPVFRTRTKVHEINGLYYDVEGKRFLRKWPKNDKFVEKKINPDRQELIVHLGNKIIRISFSELQKQYPQITNLYDPTKPIRIRNRKTNDFGQSELSEYEFGDSTMSEISISSFI